MNSSEELKYSYSSKPRAVQTNRSKAHGNQPPPLATKPAPPNIMHDPRIVRGTVLAAHLVSPRGDSSKEKPKKRRSQRSLSNHKSATFFATQTAVAHSYTPFSLDEHLIEQPRVTPEREIFSQTDAFTRYVTPKKAIATADGKFHRPKVGVDSGTQIEDSDKLFNFDAEVKPLLNVLVSKTLAQALAEVKEEMEMASIVRERHVLVASKREAERVDKKLEDDAKTAFREKEQKKRDQALRQQRVRVMRGKVLAWQLARSTIVPDAIAAATRTLTEKGVFYNPVHRDLMQWLASEIYSGSDVRLRLRVVAASLLDDLLDTTLRRQSLLARLLPAEDEALVRITLRDPIVVDSLDDESSPTTREVTVLGPVMISRRDSLDLIERKLQEWATENIGPDVAIPLGGFLSLLPIAEPM